MEFRILGPLEVRAAEQPVSLGGARPQRVLAALLLARGGPVSLSRLVDAVWDDAPPATAAKQVRNTVSDLRRQVTDEVGCSIVLTSGGYRLDLTDSALDADVFTHRIDQARRHMTAGRLTTAAIEFRAGLALWRGPALDGLTSAALQPQITGLNEQRLAAVEDCVDLELAQGQHRAVVSELSEWVAAHPLRERLAAQLMLAFYRSGSQAKALTVYDDLGRALADELGIDPGPDVQELRQRILVNDPTLSVTAIPHAPTEVARCDLPGDVSHFTGRAAELDHLLSDIPGESGTTGTATLVISAIDGMAGVGKTTLAVHVAHRVADRYPDGQLFIDLHAHTRGHEPVSPAEALGKLLRAAGVPGERIPQDVEERSALWRAQLAGRRMLIVLDNVVDTAQIRPLLPGGPGCVTVVTSRHRLAGLDGAGLLSLDVLSAEEAHTLFVRVVGDGRPQAELDEVNAVVRFCGYLPLAIRIAAARLRHRPAWTVAYLASRLREGQRRLAELESEDRSVRCAFRLSYQYLGERSQRLFRLLTLAPNPDFEPYAAAAVADLFREDAEQLLEGLVDAHLLQQFAPGRYRFHDLLRAYGAELAADTDSEADRKAALTRLFDHFLHTASRAMHVVAPAERLHRPQVPASKTPAPVLSGYDEGMAWLEAERLNLLITAQHAAHHGWPAYACQLSTTLWRYFHIRGNHDDALTLHTHGLTAARATDNRVFQADALASRGYIYWWLGQYERGLVDAEQGVALARETGSRNIEGRALHALGLVHTRLGHPAALTTFRDQLDVALEHNDRGTEGYALRGLGEVLCRSGHYEQAETHYAAALAVGRDSGNRNLEAYALRGLADIDRYRGRYEQSRLRCQEALSVAQATGNRNVEARALHGLGLAYAEMGQDDTAIRYFEQALRLAEDTANHYEQARAHDGLAHVHYRRRRWGGARRHWGCAAGLYTKLGVPDAHKIQANIAMLDDRLRHSPSGADISHQHGGSARAPHPRAASDGDTAS